MECDASIGHLVMGSQIIAPTKAPVPVLDGNGTTPVMTMATAMTTVTTRRHTAAVTTRPDTGASWCDDDDDDKGEQGRTSQCDDDEIMRMADAMAAQYRRGETDTWVPTGGTIIITTRGGWMRVPTGATTMTTTRDRCARGCEGDGQWSMAR